jgi:hypothetical protein
MSDGSLAHFMAVSITQSMNTSRLYCFRASVRVRNTRHPRGASFDACASSGAEAKKAYSAEPLPVREAVSAPARMSWALKRANSGHLVKTTCSKSFSAGPRSFEENCGHAPRVTMLGSRPSFVNFKSRFW